MYDKLIILGGGPSLSLYSYKKGDLIYCPLSMKDEDMDKLEPLYFGIHDHEKGSYPGIIDQNSYPLDGIIKSFQSTYFTNTISYIIAYCLYVGAKELEIHGNDMTEQDEYINQRGSVLYWIGRAEGAGVKVTMPNGIMDPFLYGFEGKKKERLINKMNYLRKHAKTQLHIAENEASKNQYMGFIHAIDMLKKMEL